MDLLSGIIDEHWNNLTVTYAEPWTVPWTVPAGERDDYEIHLVEKGDGTFFIGDRSYTVKPGDIIILHSMEGNSFKPDKPDFRHVFVTFKFKDSMYSEKIFSFNKRLIQEVMPIQSQNTAEIQQLLYSLHKTVLVRSDGYMFRLKILLGRLVFIIMEGCMTKSEDSAKSSQSVRKSISKGTRELVDRVIMFLHKNYNKQLSLKDIGHIASLHPRYLCTVFKQVTGCTINEYLRKIRIEQAKRLLLYTTLSVTEVALETGFGSSQYFSRIFKNMNGVDPRTFRKTRLGSKSDMI
ncbi:MAG: AraC family transcriptional regulator [Clostridiaceae bacterium]